MGFQFVNNVVRIVSILIVGLSQALLFNNLSQDLMIYSWILFVVFFLWNLVFIFVGKNNNFIIFGSFVDVIIASIYLFISKNPFGILLSFMVPIVTSIQFLSSYLKYLVIFFSLILSAIGLLGVFSLFSDPLFPNLLSLIISNVLVSVLIIVIFISVSKIAFSYNNQLENYKEQNELLIANLGELENKIYQYEKQIENLKNEIEQERVAFNIEMEKVIKEFQTRKDETYTQLKALNNELILKDKNIQQLNQSINDLLRDIEEYKDLLSKQREMIEFLTNKIIDFHSLYKVSENIVEFASRFIDYDTLVIFIKNEIGGELDTFLVSGENSEFYYNYKKIEMEEMYRYTFIEGKICIGSRSDDSTIRPFYPKEYFAISVPMDVADKRLGMIYISYTSADKELDIKEDFIRDIANVIGILIYTAIFYSKSINRLIWDDRLFCYSAEFIWEYINNLSFISRRYNENFALVFISFSNIIGKDINDLSEEEIKLIRETNVVIKSTIRETDMISFIGNGIITIVLTKVDKEKVEIVCKRVKNMVDNKLNLWGYEGESYMICSVYPYDDIDISQLIQLSIERLTANIQRKRVLIEVVKK